MATKTFQTLFKIGSKFDPQGFKQADQAIVKTGNLAGRTNQRIKGMYRSTTAALATYGIGSRAFNVVVQGLQKSIAAAGEAQQVHDELSLALERNAKAYDLSGTSIGKQVEALIKLAEQFERTGHDAEVLEAGWAKLLESKALSPKGLQQTATAFSDVLSALAGANATQEESVQLGEEWSDAILQGKLALGKRMNWTKDELKQFRKLTDVESRRQFIQQKALRYQGETARVFEKQSGKIAQMQTQIGNIYETLGAPFVERAGSLGESFKIISESLKPTAEKIAEIVDVQLKTLGEWLDTHKVEIPKFLEDIFDWLKKIQGIADYINDLKWEPLRALLKLWREGLGEPARLPQLPGAPPQMPLPGAAGTQGEAAKRANEARSFYQEGYPSAMPGKIGAAATGGLSPALIDKVKQMEGYAPKAFWDYKQYSIGYGTRAKGAGQTTTPGEAEKDLEAELSRHQKIVDRAAAAVGLKLTPGQRDALTSFDFNTGDAARLIMSSGGSVANIAKRLPSWNKAGGRVNQGLINRRAMEMQMFNAPGGGVSLNEAIRGMTIPRTAATGTAPINVSMNPTINVTGVSGSPEAIGQQVAKSMRDPINHLLDQIKAARAAEARLGYI